MQKTLVSNYGSTYEIEAEHKSGTIVAYFQIDDGCYRVRIQHADPGALTKIAGFLARSWDGNKVKMAGVPHLSIEVAAVDLKIATADACRAMIQAF